MSRPAHRQQRQQAPSATALWRMGMYIRLSREDDSPGLGESGSVVHQRLLLTQYYRDHAGEFLSCAEYTDDGCTGTDTNRPGFQRLLDDIRAGAVNCVLVKDLSRLSRNYYEAGMLLENVFVAYHVRLICLGEPAIDSYTDPDSLRSISVPLYNVMNDWFAQSISQKIRANNDSRRRKGEFIGGFATYGYQLDPGQKGHLIIDPEAAEVVALIFQWFVEGMSKSGIAKKLNELGIPSPSVYKRQQGLNHNAGGRFSSGRLKIPPVWTYSTINHILHNEVYTGTMVQGRVRVVSHKIHRQMRVPEDRWFRREGTHEPILTRETFDRAQALMARDTKTAPARRRLYLFSGFLRCVDCHGAMHRRKFYSGGQERVEYVCGTYKKKGHSLCTRHTVKHPALESSVTAVIQQLIALLADAPAVVRKVDEAPSAGGRFAALQHALSTKEQELAQLRTLQKGIVQEKILGNLSAEVFQEMKREYEQREQDLRAQIRLVNTQHLAARERAGDPSSPLLEFAAHHNIRRLNRTLLGELVHHIEIGEGGALRICLRLGDPFGATGNPIL